MTFGKLSDQQAREIVPGFFGKFVHTDRMTVSYWTIDEGAVLPEHHHPHEQITTVIEGQLELTVDGETRVLGPLETAVIPSEAVHGGRAVTNCFVIDVFQPARDDYR
ncbi:MAG TPA: cupin domain-containing protein [Aggregatilinea sp.]|jgi:quercetin dioxygenase-like cupin family protein|uniref:cupin domain-containing protein n=1 Tax=Aggregatilinea sp. TaxID=2806333 RepID=UPI002CAFC28D|nr:cupin domain-containing protein [Aggregatilinea sp.]HML24054.1 cupin domain-containing protein [Aggregatilinea sp.]